MRALRALVLTLAGGVAASFALPVLAQSPVMPIGPAGAGGAVEEGARVTASAGGRLGMNRSVDIRWGPFLVSPGFGIGLGADATATAASENQSRSLEPRFFLDAGPSLDLILPLNRQHTFSVTGQAFYRYYTSENEDTSNGWNYRGTGGYRFQARNLTVEATYDAWQRQETLIDFIEQGGTVPTTEFADRVEVLTLTPGARVQLRTGSRSSLTLSGFQQEVRYAEDERLGSIVASELNRTSFTAQGSFARDVGARSQVMLLASAERTDYEDPDSFRDSWRYRAGIRGEFGNQFEQVLTGSLEAGVENVDVAQEGLQPHTGPYALGLARYRLLPRLGLWLRAEVRTFPTVWENNVYAINEGGGTGIDYWLSRSVNLGAFVDYGAIRYPEETSFEQDDGSLLTGKRRDTLVVYRGDLTLRLLGQAISIQGGYFDRQSNFDIANSSGLFLRLGFSAFFSRNL